MHGDEKVPSIADENADASRSQEMPWNMQFGDSPRCHRIWLEIVDDRIRGRWYFWYFSHPGERRLDASAELVMPCNCAGSTFRTTTPDGNGEAEERQ